MFRLHNLVYNKLTFLRHNFVSYIEIQVHISSKKCGIYIRVSLSLSLISSLFFLFHCCLRIEFLEFKKKNSKNNICPLDNKNIVSAKSAFLLNTLDFYLTNWMSMIDQSIKVISAILVININHYFEPSKLYNYQHTDKQKIEFCKISPIVPCNTFQKLKLMCAQTMITL